MFLFGNNHIYYNVSNESTSMEYFESIVETIGNTPLIKLHSYNHPAIFLGKMEIFNPGRSSKDRVAVTIIDEAEKNGEIKEGGTIIEATSGNTGLGLALVGIQRGYKVILVMPDKMSPDKMNLVKALGCEVIVCPVDVEPDDPRSYYSVSKKLAEDIPNSFYANQYHNPANPLAHYQTTGPEIWRQTEGKITHYIVGVGTGGTISGVARYLKEKNPNVKVIGVDPKGSILAHYHKHRTTKGIEAKGYKIEGVGEDIIPKNVHFDLIDEIITITDQEAFEWSRKLALEEGLLLGGSSGMVAAGVEQYLDKLPKDAVVVALFPDTGERYLGRVFSDSWLRSQGFLPPPKTIEDILRSKSAHLLPLISVEPNCTLDLAIEKIKKFRINQLIVKTDPFKVIFKKTLYDEVLSGTPLDDEVSTLEMLQLPIVSINAKLVDLIFTIIRDGPTLIKDGADIVGFLTSQDLVNNITLEHISSQFSQSD